MDRSDSALKQWGRVALWGIPPLFLAVFFAYPLLTILDTSLRPDGVWDLSGFVRIVTSVYYRDVVGFTVLQAILSTVITVGLALPCAYVFTRYRFMGKSWLLSLSALPFVLPTVVVAGAFQALLGENGVVNEWLMAWFNLIDAPIQLERTLALILIAHVFYNFSVAFRMITGYWLTLSPRIEEVAQVLGARGWQLWWYVRLPLLRPVILASAMLVFIFTFTSFGVVLLLGGVRFATLEVQIYYQAVSLFDLPMAGALSLVQLVLTGTFMVAYTRLQRQVATDWRNPQVIAHPPHGWLEWGIVIVTVTALIVGLMTPLLALVGLSLTFRLDGLSVEYYAGLTENARNSVLFVPPVQAIGNSLIFALMATVMATVLGVIASLAIVRTQWRWETVYLLPLATSAVTLGFGYLLAFDTPPLNWRASWWLIPVTHTLVALPFVMRSLLPALRGIPPALTESAQVLGASPWQVWRWVEFPLIGRALSVGMVFAFTMSMGEFGVSAFLVRPDTPTLPVAIFRLIGQPMRESYGQALALSVILLFVCAISFALIERWRERYEGGW